MIIEVRLSACSVSDRVSEFSGGFNPSSSVVFSSLYLGSLFIISFGNDPDDDPDDNLDNIISLSSAIWCFIRLSWVFTNSGVMGASGNFVSSGWVNSSVVLAQLYMLPQSINIINK